MLQEAYGSQGYERVSVKAQLHLCRAIQPADLLRLCPLWLHLPTLEGQWVAHPRECFHPLWPLAQDLATLGCQRVALDIHS
jgi:hypothetical protein